MAIAVADFDFDLPETSIAQDAAPRGASRLLVVDRRAGQWRDAMVRDLPSLLTPSDVLVVNDTRVFPARLLGRREPSGGGVECFLLERRGAGVWDALMSPGRRLPVGARVIFDDPARAPGVMLRAEVVARGERGRRTVQFAPGDDAAIDAAIDAIGRVPLPPYIKREDRPDDRERYQTLFAAARGSVAAPTAGLHFSDEILAALDARGVPRVPVTLHVGYGTFKPVKVETVEAHRVDPEPYVIPRATLDAMAAARARGGRVMAVGTTTTRALEHWAATGSAAGEADNFLYAGHRFQAIDGLMTNFHLPKSSLLMLVCAFGGHDLIMRAYRHAVASGYRFYSYGDAMVIL